ncbi:MAG: kynureninase [Marivita sp.]|uniref:kynureninase n=1 Tax=Marivita sp. TaxID=2003365 RepID=UPI001B2EE5A9|nr:kynureninase [Marivita sp.]MBO6883988.1 kynureninase [Marivita sp.]
MTDFTATRAAFHLPEGMIYLDGNSLGPLPKSAAARVAQTVTDEWGDHLITGWNACGWMEMPARLGDRIGRLIGAESGHVVVGDTLSIKVFQALAAAVKLNPNRRVILSDTGNFPSDLYMAEGLISLLGPDYELRLVAPEEVEAAITDEIAVSMITEVDYRTGRKHDMAALTAKAHEQGVVTVWDLAHSAGAIPVDLAGVNADFAVGCTYKYLNGGPGAPAFIYVSPRHADMALPALSGWLGHDSPFAFDLGYKPGAGISRMRVGTPPIVQMAALDAALDVWDDVDLQDLHARSIELSERFIAGVESTCPDLTLASPRDAAVRGSQISFKFDEGYAAMQALIAHKVIGDFRAPDIMRFGFTPLYLSLEDVDQAVEILARIMRDRLWDTPEFKQRKAVT